MSILQHSPGRIARVGRAVTRFRERRPLVFWGAVFAFVAVSVSMYDFRGSSDPAKWHTRGDFADISLRAARLLAAGESPYGHPELAGRDFRYFPLNALLYVPLTLVPVPVAQGIWWGANVVLLLWALGAHRKIAGLDRARALLWTLALAVSFRFMYDCLKLGQWNLPVYTLTALGLWLVVARRRPWLGGGLIGLAAGLKYMPIAFVIYFLAKRSWRPAAAVALGAVFWVIVLPTVFLGWERHASLLKAFVHQGTADVRRMTGNETVVGNSLYTTIYAYLTPCVRHPSQGVNRQVNVASLTPAAARAVAYGVCVALVAATLVAFVRGGRGTTPGLRTAMELGLMFLLLMMISPEVRKAQLLTTFTPAFALAAVYFGTKARGARRTVALAALLVAFALVVVCSKTLPGVSAYTSSHGGLTLVLLVLYAALMFLYLRPREEVAASPSSELDAGPGPGWNADRAGQAESLARSSGGST